VCCCFQSSFFQSRQLAVAPDDFAQVGQTLIGTNGAVGTTGNVEFGTAVALAGTGLRLAVGARRHYWTNADGTGTVVNNAGGVFVYGLSDPLNPSSDWILKTSFIGEAADQEMGRWVSMSSDGSIIAIRRGVTGSTEVWQVDAVGGKTQLGVDISCSGSGGMVSLSSDGQRLAVTCGGDTGLVDVLDWNSSSNKWDLIGTLFAEDATSANSTGLFGFDTAFSTDGNWLAVSAPDFAHDTLLEQGVVRVFDFNDTDSTWNQVGQDLLGDEASQKFGFAMDMSSDGNTLVIGSPNRYFPDGNATGAVEVFTLLDGAWTSQNKFLGENVGDRLGWAVAVTGNGNQFVASSFGHNGEQGQMNVFRLFDATWGRVAEFEGSSAGDRLGGNSNLGVVMTDDGELFAAGNIRAHPNGIVEVFDDISTPQPSQVLSHIVFFLLVYEMLSHCSWSVWQHDVADKITGYNYAQWQILNGIDAFTHLTLTFASRDSYRWYLHAFFFVWHVMKGSGLAPTESNTMNNIDSLSFVWTFASTFKSTYALHACFISIFVYLPLRWNQIVY
jgi:hypothetical protein